MSSSGCEKGKASNEATVLRTQDNLTRAGGQHREICHRGALLQPGGRDVPEPGPTRVLGQGRDPQSGSDDFRGTFFGRGALEPLPPGSSQGHSALDTVGTLRPEVATPGSEMPRRNNEPGMREQKAEMWTTEELKSRVREGPVDQQVALELVRRLEEVELRTKSSSSLHSALEHVHSEARPHQFLPYRRETGRVERFRVVRLQVRRGLSRLLFPVSASCATSRVWDLKALSSTQP